MVSRFYIYKKMRNDYIPHFFDDFSMIVCLENIKKLKNDFFKNTNFSLKSID